jgi:hypothetical protein
MFTNELMVSIGCDPVMFGHLKTEKAGRRIDLESAAVGASSFDP